jgi:molecular chaperone GrpE
MSEKKIVIPSDEEMAKFSGQSKKQGDSPADSDSQADNPAAPDESSAAPTAESSPADEYKDKYLRAVAELSNFRKRAQKDRQESLRYANADLVRSLIPVLDNLERVVASAEEHPENTAAIVDGVKLTVGAFRKALSDHQVNSIDAEDRPFDPSVHEAMMQQPDHRYDTPTVLQVLEEGFKLFDRVIRPARVVVSKPPEDKTAETNDE